MVGKARRSSIDFRFLTGLTIIIGLLSSTKLRAQSWGHNASEIEPIVRYYPFYDGVQMVEVDYLTAYHETTNELEFSQPRALPWSMVLGPPRPNTYFWRTHFGEIVVQYGPNVPRDVKLLSPAQSEKEVRPHSHWSNRFGAGLGTVNQSRFYPYYLLTLEDPEQRKFGLVDSLGQVRLAMEYDEVRGNFSGSGFLVRQGERWSLLDVQLTSTFSTRKYRLQWSELDTLIYLRAEDRVGLLTLSGRVLLPVKYHMILPGWNEHGLMEVRDPQRRCGFVDRMGREVIPTRYASVGRYKEGLVPARLNEKWGFLDAQGREVVPFRYTLVSDFQQGFARVGVKRDGVYFYGFIDKDGKEVVPLIYSDATNFEDGVAWVRIDFHKSGEELGRSKAGTRRMGQWIKIDSQGKKYPN